MIDYRGEAILLRAQVADLEAMLKVETEKKFCANLDLMKAEARVAELEAALRDAQADVDLVDAVLAKGRGG